MPLFGHYNSGLAFNTASVIQKNVNVTVYLPGTTTLASLFTTRTGTAKANPFATDATTGNWDFYATAGEYDLLVGGVTTRVTLPPDPHELVVYAQAGPFFAKGDNATTTTTQIQAAIASLPTDTTGAYGGTVHLGDGVFIIDADLTIPNGVRLRGNGPSRTQLKAKANTTFTKAMIRNADASGNQEFAWVSDMYVTGNKLGTATVPFGILFDSVFVNSGINNVVVADCTGNGIQVQCLNNAGGIQNSGPIRINDVWSARNNGHQIEVLGQVNQCWLADITVENQPNSKAGIHIKGPLNAGIVGGFTTSIGHSIKNVHYESAAAPGWAVWLEDQPYVSIDGVHSSASVATSVMVRITGTNLDDTAHSVRITCRNIYSGPGLAIDDVTRGVQISTGVMYYDTNMTITPTSIGFLGKTPAGVQSLGVAAIDALTTQTLANNLRTALINLGLGQT